MEAKLYKVGIEVDDWVVAHVYTWDVSKGQAALKVRAFAEQDSEWEDDEAVVTIEHVEEVEKSVAIAGNWYVDIDEWETFTVVKHRDELTGGIDVVFFIADCDEDTLNRIIEEGGCENIAICLEKTLRWGEA